MSYSFNLAEPSKAAAKMTLRKKIAEVMAQQTPHCHEMPAVQAAAEAMIDAQVEPLAGQMVFATLYGSVTTPDWQNPASPLSYAQANITVNVA